MNGFPHRSHTRGSVRFSPPSTFPATRANSRACSTERRSGSGCDIGVTSISSIPLHMGSTQPPCVKQL